MLNQMMTDKQDPISGHDPDTVIDAFNSISDLAPRVADHPAAVGPLLRRKLQGNVQPFEAKELAELEKTVRQTNEPYKTDKPQTEK